MNTCFSGEQRSASLARMNGYIEDFDLIETANKQGTLRVKLKYALDGTKVIHTIDRRSKPGCRVYSKVEELPEVEACWRPVVERFASLAQGRGRVRVIRHPRDLAREPAQRLHRPARERCVLAVVLDEQDAQPFGVETQHVAHAVVLHR